MRYPAVHVGLVVLSIQKLLVGWHQLLITLHTINPPALPHRPVPERGVP